MTKPTNGSHNAAVHKICEERTPAVATTAMIRSVLYNAKRCGSAGLDAVICSRRKARLRGISKKSRVGIKRWSPAYCCRESGAGNKSSGGTLSVSQGSAGSRLRLVSTTDPVSDRFSDQLIGVLPRLRRFARGLSGSLADADDLVQAACERALARQHQFQEGTRFDSWMFRIVQTIWIDQVRARDVRKENGDIAEERLGSDEPVRRVEARLALDEVRRAVYRLAPDQRTALLLVTVEGLTYKEAAEVVQVPVGTIMSRLARARLALQLQLDAGREAAGSNSNAAAQ
jgi:RNA polymerase sigma-70 factor, ECF subfamily